MVNFAPGAVPILALALLAAGCRRSDLVSRGGEVLTPSPADLQPDATPGDKAMLRFGAAPDGRKGRLPAMEFEVRLLRAKDGSETVLKLSADREVLEREVYESSRDAFRLVLAGDDGFAPPLDLVRFPARAGESWEWDGKAVYAGISRESHARVTLGRDGNDIRSDVDQTIEVEAGRPALTRRFSFWFEKGHGVVRRTFGRCLSASPGRCALASLGAPIPLTDEARREVRRLDWPLVGAALILLTFGMMSMFSVSYDGGGPSKPYFIKQAINVAIGLVPATVLALAHPKVWRRGSSFLYVFDLLLLLAVLVMGKHTKGAERWIPLPGGVQFQPSELAKLLTILTLSAFYAHRQETIDRLSTFLLGLLHVAVPIGLIFVQPHLGATIVVAVAWFAVSVVAGVPIKYLGGLLACLLALAGIAFAVPTVRDKVFKGYQLGRIEGQLGGKKDIKGKNWQTDRAEIAFGVGGVEGAGFGEGTQKRAGYIPEQHNDFVVTILGEEGGLIGCMLLLMAYAFFYYRIFLVMLHTSDSFGKMAAGGVFAVLAFHTFVNMAMVLQIVPVVGLWLPFMSYGGTAMWLCLACVGLLLGIRRRERPILF